MRNVRRLLLEPCCCCRSLAFTHSSFDVRHIFRIYVCYLTFVKHMNVVMSRSVVTAQCPVARQGVNAAAGQKAAAAALSQHGRALEWRHILCIGRQDE
jgi:hypothetical protein